MTQSDSRTPEAVVEKQRDIQAEVADRDRKPSKEGAMQAGAVGQPLPRPFVAVVVDDGDNRLAGVPVTFNVVGGGGTIGGLASAIVSADGDGRAAALLTLGPDVGHDVHRVEATFAGNTGPPAVFTFLC